MMPNETQRIDAEIAEARKAFEESAGQIADSYDRILGTLESIKSDLEKLMDYYMEQVGPAKAAEILFSSSSPKPNFE